MDPQQVYSTIDVQDIVKNVDDWIDKLKPQLRSHSDYEENVIEYYISLLKEVARIAPSFDYKDIPCNGWRSILRYNQYFIFRSLDALTRKEVADFCSIIKLFSFYIEGLIKANRATLKGDDGVACETYKNLFLETDETIVDTMAILCNNRYLAMSYPSYKWIVNIFIRVTAQRYASNLIVGSKFWYMPYNSVASKYVEMSGKLNSAKVTRAVCSIDELPMQMSVKSIYIARNLTKKGYVKTSKHRVAIKSHYRFDIDKKTNATALKRMKVPFDNEIKFRILKNTQKGEYEGKIFYYIHGGGFVGPKASSLEHLYIKDWVNKLPGCSVINMDYPYSPRFKFPSQIQEIVDFYLWLTSDEEEVVKIFGFKPSEIIVGGESAGGNLAVALSIALNDIAKMGDETVKMPKAVVGMFGSYEVSKRMTPSLLLTATDTTISYPILRIMANYARYRFYDGKNNNINNNSEKKTWKLGYVEDEKRAVFTDDTLEPEPSPYFQPLLYDSFDDGCIKQVPLFIVALDFCPFLDQSVTLAHKWKGPVDFKHVDNTPHSAFFGRNFSHSITKPIMDACVLAIQSALRA